MSTAAKWSIGVFMALGLFLLSFGIYFIYEAVASTSWNQVEGKITNTRIAMRSTRSGNSTNYRHQYDVTMTYEYQVNGIKYQNSRFSLGSGSTIEGGFNEKQQARDWLKNSEYKIGKAITVYVKPGQPEETVISSGLNWGTFVPMILGSLMIGLVLLWKKLVKLPQKQNQVSSL
ncbi:MAG: DUF3592 domain-containing protein [Gammaproteobacteria bacterium]|jgi:hypothetical protein